MEIDSTAGREGYGGKLDFSEHTCYVVFFGTVCASYVIAKRGKLKLEKQELSKPSFSSALYARRVGWGTCILLLFFPSHFSVLPNLIYITFKSVFKDFQ